MKIANHASRPKKSIVQTSSFTSSARRVGKIASFIAAVALAASAHAAAVADFGTTAPTPGLNDVSQLSGGNNRDGLNYYADNSSPPGQTFTTGSNPSGYGLTSFYVKTGGYDANNTGTAQTYTLRIYSVSGGTATLISTYTSDNVLGFTDGTWLKYSGLTNILQPNTVYAYTHARNTVGWDGMGCATGNPYVGGEICLIPTAGGAITFGATHNSDAAFLVNLLPITDPFVFPTYINTPSAVGGNSVVISAGVGSGTQPIAYQWLFSTNGGVAAKIPGATGVSYTISSVQTTNAGTYSLMVSNRPGGVPTVITNTPASLVVRAAYNIATTGGTAPTTGVYDIAQLTAGTDLDGLNYFADNATPPGQTFTTGSNPAGYTLTAIQLKTAGVNSSATGTAKTYTLRLYSVAGGTATLISTYLTDNTVGFTDGDWLKYTGMTNVLQPNTVYAYTHRQNGSGWDQISAVLGGSYAGGQACLIPTAGGTITFGPSASLEATFQVSMVPNGFPAIQNVGIAPANTGGNPVYAGTPVTLTVQAAGATPLTYRWQTDNGLGGAFSDIPSSNTNSFGINTTGLAPGTYNYQVIVTNVNSSATSSVVTLNLAAASGAVLVTDTAVSPTVALVGGSVQVSAAFTGTLPISYQWLFTDANNVTTSIVGATSSTYNIGSAVVGNTGSYTLVASNAVGGAVTVSSTPASLLVANLGQANTSSAGIFDATSTPPTPGTYDIAQLVTAPPTAIPLLNYYVDNVTAPGQTFTTGNTPPTPAGYQLSSIYLQEELSTASSAMLTNSESYTLGIYSVTGNNAVLLTSYVSTNTLLITEGNWIKWTGLTNILKADGTYAFSIQRNGTGWWKLANNSTANDLYAGGQVASLPSSGYGAMIFSSDPTIDAGFLVALTSVVSSVNTTPTNIIRAVSGNSLTLSWPSDHTGWRLQSQTNSVSVGLRTNWVDVAGSTTTNQVTVPMNRANGSVFYRMVYP